MSWLTESHHWQHIVGGLVIGVISNDWWCAALSGVGIASALEFKDKSWGGKWDWTDWTCTTIGTAIGFVICLTIKTFLL